MMEKESRIQTVNGKEAPTPSPAFSTDTAFSQYQTSPNAISSVPFSNLWSSNNNPTNQLNVNPFNPLQNNPQPSLRPPTDLPMKPITPHSLLSSPTATSLGSPMPNMMTEDPSNSRQQGSDRKRSRRSLIDDSALEDIMGQSK